MSSEPNTYSFRAEVEEHVAEALREIGATFIKHTCTGEGWQETNVCFYSAADKIIAITHAPRDGFTCYISGEGSQLSQYETWDTLWRLLGMDKNTDTDEGLLAYTRMFPDDAREYMKFMGSCLVKCFEQLR